MGENRDELLAELSREGRRLGSTSTLHNHACADLVGINPTDWDGLDVLDWTGPLTAGQLAGHVGLTSGAITGVIDRLEEAGFVRRAPDPHDRRKVIVHLRRDKDRQMGEVFDLLARALDDLTARYSDAELAVIVDFLRGANEALVDSTERMRAAARARKQGRPPSG
ncbi:MAG TPA: MarR family transcriptional regulator [Acidimicrobiales bacterium]